MAKQIQIDGMSDNHLDRWIDCIDWFHTDGYLEVIDALERDEDNGGCIVPAPENILHPFTWFEPEDTRVVILNEEPIADLDKATGLPLSVSPECPEIPNITQNILDELTLDIGGLHEHGCLNNWAKQGVLMLNLSMSVLDKQPGSHDSIGWSGLIDDVVKWINTNTDNRVFLLWGKKTHGKRVYVNKNHCVIPSSSPNAETVYRGFFGSRPFSKANRYFSNHELDIIDWSL